VKLPLAIPVYAIAFLGTSAQPPSQPCFASPTEAAHALVKAVQADDSSRLMGIFGSTGNELIVSGDAVRDAAARKQFVQRAKERISVQAGTAPEQASLLIGADEIPFPIPLVRSSEGWRFDTQAGTRELRARRVGANELDAIALCALYVSAQYEFASSDRDGSGIGQYAQRLISTPGKQDGLYWETGDNNPYSPFAELARQAAAEGYDLSGRQPIPYRGYYFRLLGGQGPNAEDGARQYLVRNLMIGGFAMLAWPAEYGVSGIKSFAVNQTGRIYEADLGSNTAALAPDLKVFNPARGWRIVR
jgi:Protein of unknown function (DUF2950)